MLYMPKKSSKKVCKKGEILRKAYYRKPYVRSDGTKVKGAYVKAVCIPDKGRPGKGPQILPPMKEKGRLKKYGYKLDKLKKDRQAALLKAVKKYGLTSVIREIVYIRTLQKSNKVIFKKLDSDYKFLKKILKDRR